MEVTKLDAARWQLGTAIWLYFHEADPISIHTLTKAAYDVINALNKKRHSPMGLDDMMLKDLGDEFLSSKAQRRMFHDFLNEAANFFKHGNSDPTATLSFDTSWNEVLLFDAVRKYCSFVADCPKEMLIYQLWFELSRPEIQLDIPNNMAQLETFREMLLKDGRKGFYQHARTFFGDEENFAKIRELFLKFETT